MQISLAAGDDFAWIGAADADTVRVETDAGEIATDGRFGLVRFRDGAVVAFNVQDGSFLSVAGAPVFSADREIDVSLAFGDGGMAGFFRGSQDGYQVVVHTADSVGVVTYQNAVSASVYGDGAVTLQLSGAGQLAADTLPIAGSPANDPPTGGGVGALPTDYDGSGKVDLLDFFLFSDAFGEPVDEDSARFDLDGNGVVNLLDFFLFADTFGATAG